MTAPQVKVSLHEWERYSDDDCPFLRGVTLPDDSGTQRLLERLDRSGMLHIVERRHGVTVEATSYVGRVSVGPLQVTVQPKLAPVLLLRLLRYAYGLRHLELFDPAAYGAARLTFQDLLVHQLAAEAHELIARGLRRSVVRREADLASPRGRIDIGRLALMGGVRQASLPCTVHDMSVDSLVNRVLLAGLKLGRRMTSETALRARLGRLAVRLEGDVSDMRLTGHALSRVRQAQNRLTSAYGPALRLIEVLYGQEGVSLDEDEASLPLQGFLFDMNRFYQALLSRFLRENLPGCVVRDEQGLREILAYSTSHNPYVPRRRAPTPRPDYVVYRGHEVLAILDAKYRDLWEQDLPRDWLYQLAIYALAPQSRGRAAILYPTISEAAREARIDIRDPELGLRRAQIILKPVDLNRLDWLVSARGHRREREQFALSMVTGLTRE